ncbi:MAG: hypothetical protein AAGJ97_15720, partial [Planctomycetota bacterium]
MRVQRGRYQVGLLEYPTTGHLVATRPDQEVGPPRSISAVASRLAFAIARPARYGPAMSEKQQKPT